MVGSAGLRIKRPRLEVLADPGPREHGVGVEGVLGQRIVFGVVLAVGLTAEKPVAAGVG
jgi:hypothetical protein